MRDYADKEWLKERNLTTWDALAVGAIGGAVLGVLVLVWGVA